MSTTIGSAAVRVARGAKLLDEIRPGWAAEIAQDRLAMASCTHCILGQLYGSYGDGALAVGLDPFWRQTQPYGFYAADGLVHRDKYAELAELWRTEIRSRLEHSAPPVVVPPSHAPAIDLVPVLA